MPKITSIIDTARAGLVRRKVRLDPRPCLVRQPKQRSRHAAPSSKKATGSTKCSDLKALIKFIP